MSTHQVLGLEFEKKKKNTRKITIFKLKILKTFHKYKINKMKNALLRTATLFDYTSRVQKKKLECAFTLCNPTENFGKKLGERFVSCRR